MKNNGKNHQPKFTVQMTWPQFERIFPDEEACHNYLFSHRWPAGVKCPRCHKSKHVYKIAQPWKWECWNAECASGHAYRFSLIAGTIFENTKYPLRTWFWVLFLMLTSKKGISALQIHRTIESASYKTAFYMCHRLRAAMNDPEFRQLMGIVEVDETYIGGLDRNRHANKKHHKTGGWGKTPVIGAISRKGNLVCKMIERADMRTMHRFVAQTVSRNVELVATDEHSGYQVSRPLDRNTASDRRPSSRRIRARNRSYQQHGIVLVAAQTWNHRDLPQCEQEISAAVPCGILVPIQQ